MSCHLLLLQTTTIGKLAYKLSNEGARVFMVPGEHQAGRQGCGGVPGMDGARSVQAIAGRLLISVRVPDMTSIHAVHSMLHIPAGDTFRAAAAEQLGEWAKRANAKIGPFEEGAPPQKVNYFGSASQPTVCQGAERRWVWAC
jgi:hypothetical protein